MVTYKSRTSRDGSGVVVGIVDSGIDASHAMFANRIHSIWDQLIQGPGWGTTNYGTVLSGATLTLGTDQNGHGTHVAGIAAGNNATYLGVAQNATIVAVKTDFQTTSIADGVRFVFSEAQNLGLPAVVNLSLGAHFDPHDGSDDLSALIDQQTGPGRIVVAAAGNEGTDAIHAALTIQPGAVGQAKFQVTPSTQSGAAQWVILNGWYPGASNCEVQITTSAGGSTPWQGVAAAGALPASTYNIVGGLVQITTPLPTVNANGDHQFLVELGPASQTSGNVQGGLWTLSIRNRGNDPVRVDVWSNVPEAANPAAFQLPAESPDMKIGSPGCAGSAVTVAA